MKIFLNNFIKSKHLLNRNTLDANRANILLEQIQQQRLFNELGLRASFVRQNSHTGPPSKKLLLSPTEATKILRTHEATVDVESNCAIKYYDVNYLGSNIPAEDRQAQAKLLSSDVYLFGVFDGYIFY